MKTIFSLLAALIFLGSLSSCNKTFTCKCTFTDTTRNFEFKLEKMRKNDAKVLCTDYDSFVGNCAIQ